jgi:hypothetical protein
MTFLHGSTIFGACVIATTMMFAPPVYANPDDYSFELAAVGPDRGIVTIRLKNKTKGQLVSSALIDCAADVGPQGVTTMTAPVIAHPDFKPGEYLLILEPGMQAFDLDLFAEVPGESQVVHGKIHVKDQGAH